MSVLPRGPLQATYEQADARLTDTFPTTGLPGNVASIIAEAPRLIGGISGTYDKLPFHLRTKAEFEYVGRKVVGTGCNESAYLAAGNDLTSQNEALALYCLGAANKEFRLALARPFLEERINVGLNMMIATGFTGQTTENFATNYQPRYVGPLPVPENPIAEVVGVRIPSYASVNFTYRFGR